MRILKNDTCNSFTFNLCTPAIASGAYFGTTRHRLCTEIEPRQPYSHLKMRWFTPRQDYPNLPSYRCEDPLRRAYGTGVETLMGPGLPRGAEGCNRSRMHAWRAPKHAYMAPSHDIARGTYESTATLKHAPRRGRVHTPPMAEPRPLGRPNFKPAHLTSPLRGLATWAAHARARCTSRGRSSRCITLARPTSSKEPRRSRLPAPPQLVRRLLLQLRLRPRERADHVLLDRLSHTTNTAMKSESKCGWSAVMRGAERENSIARAHCTPPHGGTPSRTMSSGRLSDVEPRNQAKHNECLPSVKS